ncbi:MAG: succinylglutamate desuccinylase/aspartoacylase family protein [Planctomycetes bacterium]|nr:succinylglutamate desuccinylase/aspartoacylase family protein [Planctomycetota bacterium]
MTPEKTRSFLETGHFAEGVKVRLPMLRVRGRGEGPKLVVTAAQHGRELNGIASIERVFAQLDPAKVKGEVVFLPVMNPLAVRSRRQDFPQEECRYRHLPISQSCNMNRLWPGGSEEKNGTYASAVAEVAWDRVLQNADIVIDLHGWSGSSLSLVWGQKIHRKYVRAFGLPWHMILEKKDDPKGGMLDALCRSHGMITMIAELTPQSILSNRSVGFGENGILNVMKTAGMLEGSPTLPATQCELDESHEETIVRSPVAGLAVSDFEIGDMIKRGETLVRVLSLETLESIFSFSSPHNALVWNVGTAAWGEDHTEHAVVEPGQIIGMIKRPSRILKNGKA